METPALKNGVVNEGRILYQFGTLDQYNNTIFKDRMSRKCWAPYTGMYK